MCSEGSGIGPRLAKHEDIGAGTAFKHIILHAAGVLLAGCSEGQCHLKGSIILAFVGLEETVDTNHEKMRF